MDISQTAMGRLHLQPETVDMREQLRMAIGVITPAARARGVTIEAHLPDQSLPVQVDPRHLSQILLNVLTNATKFSNHGGTVIINVEQTETSVQVRIRDTGIGISREFLPRVFQPYAQEGLGPIQSNTGLGIGLALVQDLVKTLGGTVAVDSEGRDEGAIFTLCFPVCSGDQLAQHPH